MICCDESGTLLYHRYLSLAIRCTNNVSNVYYDDKTTPFIRRYCYYYAKCLINAEDKSNKFIYEIKVIARRNHRVATKVDDDALDHNKDDATNSNKGKNVTRLMQ